MAQRLKVLRHSRTDAVFRSDRHMPRTEAGFHPDRHMVGAPEPPSCVGIVSAGAEVMSVSDDPLGKRQVLEDPSIYGIKASVTPSNPRLL